MTTIEELRKYCKDEIKKYPYPCESLFDEGMVNAYRNVLFQLPEPKEEKSNLDNINGLRRCFFCKGYYINYCNCRKKQ